MKIINGAIAATILGAVVLVATPNSHAPTRNPQSAAFANQDALAGRIDSSTTRWVSPVAGDPVVLRAFDPPEQRWNAGHRGVDIAALAGDPVYAAGEGTVLYAGPLTDRSLVSIEHVGGIRTTYEPVSPAVSKGESVVAGQPIGVVDPGHCGGAACLHWGAKRGRDAYFDPMTLLRPVIRLLG